jgi:hydroxymethylpyrimidine pyrophosphatase-like HAD family hydrolase
MRGRLERFPRALFVDLDGTLLAPGAVLTRGAAEAVQAAAARGAVVVLATGGFSDRARLLARALADDGSPRVWAITHNGGAVWDPQGALVHHWTAAPAAVQAAVALAGPRVWVTYEVADAAGQTAVHYAGRLRSELVHFIWGPQAAGRETNNAGRVFREGLRGRNGQQTAGQRFLDWDALAGDAAAPRGAAIGPLRGALPDSAGDGIGPPVASTVEGSPRAQWDAVAGGLAADRFVVGVAPRWDWRRARSAARRARAPGVLGCWCVGTPEALAPLDARATGGRLLGARYLPWGQRLAQLLGRPRLRLVGRDIGAAEASKGAAAGWLCEHLGIDPAQTAAFGDADNDLELLEFAGTAVAMANALPNVRARADLVAPANDQDGVARVLRRWLEAAT